MKIIHRGLCGQKTSKNIRQPTKTVYAMGEGQRDAIWAKCFVGRLPIIWDGKLSDTKKSTKKYIPRQYTGGRWLPNN
jgi:hypothetical protein